MTSHLFIMRHGSAEYSHPNGDSQRNLNVHGVGEAILVGKVFDRIEGDTIIWEDEPLESLARDRLLSVYKHEGFWAAMDTLRDKQYLEKIWNEGKAPWKVW